MTNEELIRQYYDGDDTALDKLYRRNLGLIRSIAKEAAKEFNCLHMDSDRPEEFSSYTKTILGDLCGEGALEFLTRVQSREYDESRAMLTTYLYPHLKGRMTRWLERSIGNLALSKDDMESVRKAQKDRDILGKCYGIFGFEKTSPKEIGMYHMMKESAVIKAKDRAIKKLEKAYPGSKLQLWKTVHRLMRRPILPPDDDTELRMQFPRYVHALAEVYGVLNEAIEDNT